MSKEEQTTQAIEHLTEMLRFKSAQDFRADINELFFAYLKTPSADDTIDRSKMLESHSLIIAFLNNISGFQKINPFGE